MSRWPAQRRANGQAALWACAACLCAAWWPGTAWAQGTWELSPYRVEAHVALDERAAVLSGDFGEHLIAALDAAVRNSVGAPWQFTSHLATGAERQLLLDRLTELDVATLPEALLAVEADKLLLAAVARRAPAAPYVVTVREYDPAARMLGQPLTLEVMQRELLPGEMLRAFSSVFAPQAQLDERAEGLFALRLRGGLLGCRDPSIVWVQPGDAFRIVLRQNDRIGRALGVQTLAWTFLTVTEVEGDQIAARLQTALRDPLTGRRRGRIEELAVAIRGVGSETRLRVVEHADAGRGLSRYEVLAQDGESDELLPLGRTDAQGEIEVPTGATVVRMLLVRHGEQIVARLPVVPGLEPRLEVTLPNDQPRLEAEGFVTAWQENFVDQVTRRRILAEQIRAYLAAGNASEADRVLSELRRLGTPRELAVELRLEKQRFVAADPRVQSRIDALFDDTQEVVTRYLDDGTLRELEAEVRAARRGATTEAAAR